ncbi:hypothetical protein VTP01DRAFT_6299 [Rhizomucor pusillus]|uniref:uncharacterized protein n=1 Tax=Rhizomucor pusillus TaxID=4840 RepID=UPI00374482F2
MKLPTIATAIPLLFLVVNPADAGFWGSSSQEQPETSAKTYSAPDLKLDYKLSFKKPYFYNGSIPFWTIGGDVIASEELIRLTPSVPNTRGWIWSDRPNPYDEWQIHMAFKVSGSHMHGGRGMAFWYTKEPMPDGPIFGARDQWDGLGLWLDSANPKTHTPTTLAILNDGSLAFASRTDPTGYIIGSCTINYRNTGNNLVHLLVKYTANTLTILLDTSGDGKDYRTCIQKAGISLPKGYYFGISAATHNPADDHDVISFETWQMNPPPKVQHMKRPFEEEKIKQGQEFRELTDEQKRNIEEAEFQVRKLREAEKGEEAIDEGIATLASVFDTQRRILEDLHMMQMQIEAMGAPTVDSLLKGDYKQETRIAASKNEAAETPSMGAIEEVLKKEARSLASQIASQVERHLNEQDRKIQQVHETLQRLDKSMNSLDQRMSVQQKRINEMTKDSAETKGTMSTLFKYILYAFGVQAAIGCALYLYWKLRVERNEKKFL